MKNSPIHQSLIELEENLKNLESARTQVETVSKKSEQIINALTKVLGQIETLHHEFELEKSGFNTVIEESLQSFDQVLATKSNSFSAKAKALNQDFSTSVDSSIRKLHEFQKQLGTENETYISSIGSNLDNLEQKLEKKLEALGEHAVVAKEKFLKSVDSSIQRLKDFQTGVAKEQNLHNQSIEKRIETFNQILQNKSNDFTGKADELSNRFSKVISGSSQKLTDLIDSIDEASNRVQSLDFEKNFREMKNELNEVKNEVSSFKKKSINFQQTMMEGVEKQFQNSERKIFELSEAMTENKQENQKTTMQILEKIEESKKANKRGSLLNLAIIILGFFVLITSMLVLN